MCKNLTHNIDDLLHINNDKQIMNCYNSQLNDIIFPQAKTFHQ